MNIISTFPDFDAKDLYIFYLNDKYAQYPSGNLKEMIRILRLAEADFMKCHMHIIEDNEIDTIDLIMVCMPTIKVVKYPESITKITKEEKQEAKNYCLSGPFMIAFQQYLKTDSRVAEYFDNLWELLRV